MLTIILLLLPLLGGLVTFSLRDDKAKICALGFALAELVAALAAAFWFNPAQSAWQLTFNAPWVPTLGISFKVGMDGISLLMTLLTAGLMPLILAATFRNTYESNGKLYGLMLLMQAALIGVFTAYDGFLFYIFWELALLPIYFICLLWGGERRVPVTLKFFIYTLAGSLLMLVGLIYLYLQTPVPHSFDIAALYATNLSPMAQNWVFWAFFVAFAIKMPIFPFHTWQPDTYTTAPTPGTMLLSGIMLKMGIYGLIRWLLPVVPEAALSWQGFCMALAVVGVVYASIIALMQRDMKRLVAYSSIAHVGIIAAGAMSLSYNGLQGAIIQMLAHGINVVALFLIVDIFERHDPNRHIESFGGIAQQDIRFAVLFFIVVLGTIALPLTNGFVGEFMLLYGIFTYSPVMAAIAGLSIILGAAYMLRLYQKTMMGNTNTLTEGKTYIGKGEMAVLLPCAALILIMGIYPKPVLDLAAPAVQQIMRLIGG